MIALLWKIYLRWKKSIFAFLSWFEWEQDGFVKFSTKFGGQKTLSDMDHCRIVLRALAHFHAYSTIIQRDSEEPLLDLWPFAVEASNFREMWGERMRPVKEQVCQYLMWRKSRPENKISAEVEEKVENAIQVVLE